MKGDRKVAQLLFDSLKAAKTEKEEQAVLSSFIAVLKKTHTESRGAKIIAALQALLEQSEKVLRPIVTSATELSDKQVKELTAKLQALHAGSTIHLDQRVDPTVLGGMSVRIDDMLYDATLKKTLHTLTTTLTQ